MRSSTETTRFSVLLVRAGVSFTNTSEMPVRWSAKGVAKPA
jgi:hypothetical protein